MLLSQLYGYEDFDIVVGTVTSFETLSDVMVASAAIVLAELIALPFLLGMYLSPLMRFVSAVLALGVSGFWLMVSLTNAHTSNIGLFSSVYEVPGGILPLLWSGLLFGLVAWLAVSDSKFRHVHATS